MKKKNIIFQIVLIVIFAILCALTIFPFLLLVSVSLSSAEAVAKFGYQLIPQEISWDAYIFVFENPQTILRAYGVTFIVSLLFMVFGVLLMAMVAYPLSRSKLKGKNAINFYIYFTMLFGGGLIPTYLLVASTLHLNNTIWVYVVPHMISPWYVFMMRTFFKGIPGEIIESATVDGASEYTIFIKMILPLSKPVLATVALMMFLGKWNDWNTALIYISDAKLYSLQYLLQKILRELDMITQMQQAGMGSVDAAKIPGETMRMAMAVVAAGPALVVFPFFQKYFVKGLTVGAVKG